MTKSTTNYKFLDISYFYKIFGSVIKGKEVTPETFCKVIPRKKEFNITIPVVIDLVPTLTYWRECKGINAVFSPIRNVFICLGKCPVNIELFKIMYPDFNEKDILYDKDTEG